MEDSYNTFYSSNSIVIPSIATDLNNLFESSPAAPIPRCGPESALHIDFWNT